MKSILILPLIVVSVGSTVEADDSFPPGWLPVASLNDRLSWSDVRDVNDRIHLYLPSGEIPVRGVFACFVFHSGDPRELADLWNFALVTVPWPFEYDLGLNDKRNGRYKLGHPSQNMGLLLRYLDQAAKDTNHPELSTVPIVGWLGQNGSRLCADLYSRVPDRVLAWSDSFPNRLRQYPELTQNVPFPFAWEISKSDLRAGERSGLFYELIRVVRELEPRYVLLENVAALLCRGLDDVLGTLASIGFDAEWHCIPAAAVGAPHIRDRIFILGDSTGINSGNGFKRPEGHTRGPLLHDARTAGADPGKVPDAGGIRRGRTLGVEQLPRPRMVGPESLADTTGLRRADGLPADSKGWRQEHKSGGSPGGSLSRDSWWQTEPDVGRVADGVSARVDRLRGLGNAVVPQVGEYIGRQLINYHHQRMG